MPTHDFLDDRGPVSAYRHRNPNGRLGGWVAVTTIVDRDAYIGRNAQVFGRAIVHPGARVVGYARVCDNAMITGQAIVRGNAIIFERATVKENAIVEGHACVFGYSQIRGHAKIYGGATVSGHAVVEGRVRIHGTADITGDMRVGGAEEIINQNNNSNSVSIPNRRGRVRASRRTDRNNASTESSNMARKFGIEIELVGTTIERVRNAFRDANIGLMGEREGYNGLNPPEGKWNIHNDGSLSYGGFELVSPILEGDAGVEEVRKVARLLVLAGARVDNTCGLHVHVDVRDLEVPSILNIAARYHRFENEINQFMPTSRRNGRWCRGMGDVCTPDSISTLLHRGITQGGAAAFGYLDRYRSLNLSAFARHGTVEFRQHNGTVNAEKMENWIRFCVNFVEASIVREPIPEPVSPPQPAIPPQVTITMPDGRTVQCDAPSRGNPNIAKVSRLHTRLVNLGAHSRNPAIGPRYPRAGRAVSIPMATLAEEFGWNLGTLRANFRHVRELFGRLVVIEDAEGHALHGNDRRDGTHCRLSANILPTATAERLRRTPPAPPPRRALPVNREDTLFTGIPVPVVTYLQERALEFAGS